MSNTERGGGSFSDERNDELRRLEDSLRRDEEIQGSVGAMMRLEGRAEIPDVRMQMGGDDPRAEEERRRVLEEENKKRQRELSGGKERKENQWKRKEEDDNYWRGEPYFKMMVKDLRVLGKEDGDEGEKRKAKERLEKRYEQVGKMQMREMSTCMKETVERYRNPHPYDSRGAHMWLDGMSEILDRADLEFEGNEEAKEWLKQLRKDCLWGDGVMNLMDGLGPIVQAFWSGANMMKAVRERVRKDPEAKDFMKAFAESLPGLESESGEKEGLREKAVKFQDESVFWRMAVASVGQIEHDRGEDGFPMTLSEKEIEFICELFGETDEGGKGEYMMYEGKSGPKSILNLYTWD